MLRLKAGQFFDYEAGGANRPITITATDAGGLSYDFPAFVAVTDVVEQPPSDIVLGDDRVIEDAPGAFIGRLRAVDPNPGATITFTTTDTRFVISGDRLSLAPGVSLDFDQSPHHDRGSNGEQPVRRRLYGDSDDPGRGYDPARKPGPDRG